MIINKLFLVKLVVFLSVVNAIAQKTTPFYETYDWEENSTANFDIAAYSDKDVVAFKDKRVSEFVVTEKGGLLEYQLIHNILWLNSNDKIEEYNKVYLPTSAVSEIIKNKARVITKEGKVIELDDSKILEAKNKETQVNYKYYALEGVEKGSFIEYFYVVRQYPSYTGKTIRLQDDFDKKNIDFELYAPLNLVFQSKSYNGLPEIVKDTLSKDKNHWNLHLDVLEASEREDQAPYEASLKQLVYKLDRNLLNPSKEIVSYGVVSQTLYSNLYPELDKKVTSKLEKFIKSIDKVKDADPENKIRLIENYIKTNIFVAKVKREGLGDLGTILDTKVASEDGIISLYGAIFNNLKIKHQIVLTSNRMQLKFDKEFEAYNFLQEYLIYFPELELYMEPSALQSRLGFPSGFLTDNYGLFIEPVSIGDFTSGIGSIKYIEPVNHDKTRYDLIMNVSFDEEDITTTNLQMDRKMSGYYAVNIQPYLFFAQPEAKDEVVEGIIKSISENVEILEKELLNDSPESFGNKPLHIKGKMKSDSFVDKAGNKYLFKVGELIGRQLEMYQEKPRALLLENDFERSYDRKIIVDTPTGYEFKNLEDINIDESYKEEGVELFAFKSTYEVKENQLVISIIEYYNQNRIPVALYENYRTIINSAANFNKVTLVLAKK